MDSHTLKSSYLLWLSRTPIANKQFGTQWCAKTGGRYSCFDATSVTYYEVMEFTIDKCDDDMVRYYWERDNEFLIQLREAEREVLNKKPIHKNKFFITITTDRDRATPDKLLKFIYQLRDKTKWIKNLSAVIENHRENGLILHTHMIIETDDTVKYGSKVKDKLWALKSLKELIGGSNYIDYVNYDERHEKYIRGEKQDSKLGFVEKDRIWREENHIPHLIEKKNN